jgi:hypothetical protein
LWRPQQPLRARADALPRRRTRAAPTAAFSGRGAVAFEVEAKQNSKKRVRQVTLSACRARQAAAGRAR